MKYTILAALFTTSSAPPEPRECTKRHRSCFITDGEDAFAMKKERMDLEAARRTSLIHEETRQMRDGELGAAASSSRLEDVERITTEGAEIAGGST